MECLLLAEERNGAVGVVGDVNRLRQRIHRRHHRKAAHPLLNDFDVARVEVTDSANCGIESGDVGIGYVRDVNDILV